MLKDCIRSNLRRLLTKEKSIVLERRIPFLERRFEDIEELGVYLHIPFCEQICPYCPYYKEIYHPDLAERYTKAIKSEINFYSDLVGNKPVTSLYIGGGTPTTMLYSGLEEILEHIFKSFNMQCDIHMESHPNHLSSDNLKTIISMFLNRPYTAEGVKAVVERAVSKDFKCVNVDFIFALPNQTYSEVEQAGHALVEMGVDQIAAYPLFIFPYTRMGETANDNNYKISSLLKRRML